MRIFLAIIIIIFSFQSWTKADDIYEFEIEGISLGDSLLDYYSEEKINEQLSKVVSTYKSEKIKRVYFMTEASSNYLQYNIHYINDSSYRILAVDGIKLYEGDIEGCYKNQIEVSNYVENNLSYNNKIEDTVSHIVDKTGKSKVKRIRYKVNGGFFDIDCTSWGKEIKEDKPWRDTLKVSISSDEFWDWLNNEAYN